MPARRASYKAPKPTILIVTEGEVTEPEYLKGFVSACHNPRVTIDVYGGAGVPKSVVEYAKEKKVEAERRAKRHDDENLRYDSVWCVFDFDLHPHIPEAKKMAQDNRIDLAISNPCIELWLWLHFGDQPGMIHRHAIKKLLKRELGSYDKHVNFAKFRTGYGFAVQRAKGLDRLAADINEPGRNPTTGFWRLTECIRSES